MSGSTTTSLNTYTYGYDAASRIIQMSSVDGTHSYSYDNTDQLTGATYSGQSNESYGYDLNGNRTNAGYQTTSNNRLQTDGIYNYSYDDEGNLTQRTTIATNETAEYTWDYRNRLTQIVIKNSTGTITKQINFTYDALNRRIVKAVDPDGTGPLPTTTERFIYDRDHIKLVFDGSNTLTRRYLHGPMIDQVLADENVVPKQISWPLSDHQRTVRDVVNNSGAIQNHIRYDSFGKIASQTAAALSPRFAYTGREWDGEIGLYFYRARYYDATVGRFIGEDPIGFGAGDTSLYRYVRNSSANLIDPMGLQATIAEPVAPPITPPVAPPIRPVPPWLIPWLIIPGVVLYTPPNNNREDEFLKKRQCQDGKKKETCQTKFPHLVPCNSPQMKRYLFPSAEDAANAAFYPHGRIDPRSRRLADKGPCRQDSGYQPGHHWNVRNQRTGTYAGSVGECQCCEESPTPHPRIKGAVLSPETH